MKTEPKGDIFWCNRINKKHRGKKTAKDTGCQNLGYVTNRSAIFFTVFSRDAPDSMEWVTTGVSVGEPRALAGATLLENLKSEHNKGQSCQA